MEDLFELVVASFARHGIESQAGDSQRVPSPASVGTAALLCPVERSLAVAGGQSNPGYAIAQTMRPAEPTELPEHNYRKTMQADPAP
jgi:hypothetical protein